MPNIACQFSIKCDCTDDPTGNFSSEDPDSDRTPSMTDLAIAPPLGTVYDAVNCGTVCFSAVSQQAADDCAYAAAQQCVFGDWHPPGDGGTPNFFGYFGNQAVTCTIRCADGTVCGVGECVGEPTFSWTVAANTVYGVNQAQANLQAASLACNRARANAICFITDTLPPACFDAAYRTQITARGGTPWYFPYLTAPFICTDPDHGLFEPIAYRWEIISGALPNGVDLGNCTGYLTGIPTQSGSFTFTVLLTDSIGSHQTKTFTLCVVKITTAGALPNASTGTAYVQNLLQTPAGQETEVWSLVSGTLPAGLSLSAAGVLSGTPTGTGDFSFTIGVTVDC